MQASSLPEVKHTDTNLIGRYKLTPMQRSFIRVAIHNEVMHENSDLARSAESLTSLLQNTGNKTSGKFLIHLAFTFVCSSDSALCRTAFICNNSCKYFLSLPALNTNKIWQLIFSSVQTRWRAFMKILFKSCHRVLIEFRFGHWLNHSATYLIWSRSFPCSSGFMLRAVVLLEGEPPLQSQVLSQPPTCFSAYFACIVLNLPSHQLWLAVLFVLKKSVFTAWFCHHPYIWNGAFWKMCSVRQEFKFGVIQSQHVLPHICLVPFLTCDKLQMGLFYILLSMIVFFLFWIFFSNCCLLNSTWTRMLFHNLTLL